jgi:hypothetical protein
MHMKLLRRILIGVLLLLQLCAALAAEEQPKDSRTTQREVQTLLRSGRLEERETALRRLKELPPLDAVRLLVQLGRDARSPEVRRAVCQMLLPWMEQRVVSDYLLKMAEKKGRSKTLSNSDAQTLRLLLMVLAASDQADVQRGVEEFVSGYLAASNNNLATLLAVADELGQQGDSAAVATLRHLSGWRQFTTVFAFRRAVVLGLIHCRRADAIDALVGLLGQIDGEVYGNVVQYLSALTNLPYGDDVNAWKLWWQKHKSDFTLGKPSAKGAAAEAAAGPQRPYSYYGLPVRGRRLVFVVDVSGSMAGPRLAMARRELSNVIGKLPPTSEFSIVAFDHRVTVWQPKLVPASPANKDAATQYIGHLQPGGSTDTYDALDAAFHFDAEAIYFLTDGKPTCGRVVDPAKIAALAMQANRSRRLSIYTIGIAPGPPGSLFDTFLKTLAEQNYGSYRHLEQ